LPPNQIPLNYLTTGCPAACSERIAMYCISFTLGLAVTVFAFPDAVTSPWNVPPSAPPRTAWIPGREFTMGPDSGLRWSDQMPGHRVRVDISRMDDTDYTRTRSA